MLMLDIRNYDNLYELVIKLNALTFLEGVVADDEYMTNNAAEFGFVLAYTRLMLYDEQMKTVLELKKLISSEGFLKKRNGEE